MLIWTNTNYRILQKPNSGKQESMVKDFFLFLPDDITQKMPKICWQLKKNYHSPNVATCSKATKGYLCEASMVRNAAWGARIECWHHSWETSRGLIGRPASEGANSSRLFCLVSVSDMRSGECRLTHQLSVTGDAPPRVIMCCYVGHVLNPRPAAPNWPAVCF